MGAAHRFVDEHPVCHQRVLAVLKALGLYKVLNRVLLKIASVAHNARRSISVDEAAAVAREEALAQQPAVVQEAFKELESVIKKAEKR